ncbi:MAG: AAA family ATPase, partial [Myxococcota bacterium]
PKGFSLLLNAGDTRLDGAFDRALTRLMARVEDEAFVRARGQGRSDDERVRSSSLLWTRFKHETSRPVRQEDGSWSTDPHRHAHVFVFNTTRSNHAGPGKGPLYALEPGPINERFPYFEAVFDNLLAEEVQGLGYGVHRRGQSFEIDGVTPEMVRAFSERTAEIDQLAAALGLSDVQKANAGVFLRARKGEVSVEDMRAHMTQRRPRIVERLDQIHAEAQGAVSRSKLSVEGQQKRAHDAVDAAAHAAVARSLERGLERKSTTPLDRLLRDALIHAAGGASEPQILSALREHKGLFVEPNERGDRYNVTTREVLEDERGLIAAMRRAQGSQRPLAPDVEPSTRLNERQQQALEHVLLSKDRLTAIRGRPGVGKSWVIEDLYRALDDRGISVVPLAPTVAASRGALREAGLAHANTLAAFLDGQNKEARALRKMARTGVIVLDEAGMVGTADFRRLLERAEQIDARVVAIGDTGQLGTMARGDGLRLLEKHGLPAADIDEILRQKNAAYLAVVEAFSDGDAALGMARAVEAGYVVDLEGAVEGVQVEGHPEVAAAAVRQLAADRTADEASEAAARGKSFMAVVPTHALGDDVSQAIRARHQASGTIKEDAVTLTLYWPTAKLQADNAEYRFTLEADEFAVVHRDVPELGLRAGDRLETFEDAKGRRGFKHGARVLDGPVPSMAFEVYREKLLPVAIGDRLRAVERIKLQGQGHAEIPRGTLLEVEKITRHGTRVEFTNGQFVSAQDVRSLTYGYAVTQPASQGLSADEVVFVATTDTFGAITKESANVAVSRGKEKLTIITDDLEGLQEQLKRSRKAPFAGEIVGDVDEHSPVGDEGRAHRHESVDELLTRLERLEGSQTGDQSGQRRDEGRARRGDAPMGVDEGVREGVGAARPSEPRAAVVVDGPVYGAVMATSSPKEPTTKKQLVVPKAERRPTGGGAERVFDGLWGPAVRRATPSPFRPHRPARSVREDHGAGILTPRLGPAGGHDSLDGRGTGSASAPALRSAEAGGFEGRPAWSAGPVEEEGGRSSEKGPGLASSARVSRREDVGVGDAEDAGRPVVDGMARRSVQSARAEGVDRRGIQALDPLALDFDNDAPRVRRSAARSKLGHADEAGQGDGAQDDARSVGAVRDLRSSSLPSLPRDLAGRRSARGQDDAQDDDTPNLAKTSESAASDARRAVNRREIAGPAGTLGLGGVAGIVEDEGMAMYASAPVEISSSRPPVGADRASGAAGSVGAKTGGAGSVDVGSGASSAPNDRGDKASSSPDDQRGRSDQTPAMPRGGRPHIGLRTDEPKKRRVRPSSTEAEEAQRARRAEEQDARAQAAEEDRQASLQVNRVQNASAEVERLKAAADHYPDDSGVQQAIEEAE